MFGDFHEAILERHEYIDPEEYLRRRERGEIRSADVEIVPPRLGESVDSKFRVKLKEPRYVVRFDEARL